MTVDCACWRIVAKSEQLPTQDRRSPAAGLLA
jgi:hypothetical protein